MEFLISWHFLEPPIIFFYIYISLPKLYVICISLYRCMYFSVCSLSSAESRRANPSQALLSRPDMQDAGGWGKVQNILVEQLKELKQTELIQAAQKTGDKWSLLHFYIPPRKRAFCTYSGFGPTMQRMTMYSCRIGLVNHSFCFILNCSEKTEFFQRDFQFLGQKR